MKKTFLLILLLIPFVYSLNWYVNLDKVGYIDGKMQFNITAYDADKVILQLNGTNYTAEKEGSNYYVYLPKLKGQYFYKWYLFSGNDSEETQEFVYSAHDRLKEKLRSKGMKIEVAKENKYKILVEKDRKRIEISDVEELSGDEDIALTDANIESFASANKLNVRDFIWVDVYSLQDYKGKIYLPSVYSKVFYCQGNKDNPSCSFIDRCGIEPCYSIENGNTIIHLNHFSGGGGGDPVLQFNQSQSINITGNASTIDQANINSYLNVNGDGLTWDVTESSFIDSWQSNNQISSTLQFKQTSREQKTVEYFIYQDMTQLAANTEKSGSFTIYIPEKNPRIKSAYVEIKNVIYNTQITAGQTIKLWNGTDNTTLLTTAAGPAATGEQMVYVIRANATQSLSFINSNGQYSFTLYTTLNAVRQGESAKIVVTYEYDSDSPRQIKTVKFFVGQLTSSLAVGSSTNFAIPPLNLPERNIAIRDSFFETYIHLQPTSTTDEGISIDLDGANAITGTPIDNAGTTTFDGFFLYKNVFDTSTSHTFNFKPTAGSPIDTIGTELILTYEYDADSPRQLKTVKYLIGQDPNIYTTANTVTFSRKIEIPDSVSIKSAYNKVRFAIAYGTGAGTTAYTTTIGVNSSIQSQPIAPQVSYTLGLRDEQVSVSTILYNASYLYSLSNGDIVLCTVYSSAASTSFYTSSKGCELLLTYEYSQPSKIKTVEYFADETHKSALALSELLNFSFTLPEENPYLKQAYIDVKGYTGYATAANILLNSSINVPGRVVQSCYFRNTGENRYDTCWDDVSDNVTQPGNYQIIVGSGTATAVTRWYNAIAYFTYNYTGAMEKNSTWQEYSFGGSDYSIIDNISSIITVSYYNPVASNSSFNNNNRPDIEVAFWNGSQYINGYFCSLSSLSSELPYTNEWNCTITTTNPSIINAWKTASNRLIRLRAVWMDNANSFSDEINITGVYAQINRTLYKLEVQHNASISYSGLILTLNASVNLSSTQNDVYNMSIYNFASNNWDSAFCQNTSVLANSFSIISCNVTSNSEDYISPSNIVSIRIETTVDDDRATMKEDYVQFYIGYIFSSIILGENVEIPSSPATYAPNSIYTFNITVNAEQGEQYISTVIFEFNGINETATTYSVYNSTARKYSVTKTDLPANPTGYAFKWYANDSNNLWGNVFSGNYIVNKASPSISIQFSSNPVSYPTLTTATCVKNSGDYSSLLTLFRNGSQVSQNSGSSASENILLSAATWNYSCTCEESENYTTSSITNQYLYINKGIPPVFLAINGTEGNVSFTYRAASNATAWISTYKDEGQVKLFRDNNFIQSGKIAAEIAILAAGEYNYSAVFEETQNYSYYAITSNRFLKINKADPQISFSINPASPIDYEIQSIAVCSDKSDEADAKIYRNETDVTQENNTFIILPAGSWYYKCNISETQNYTSSSSSITYTVNKKNANVKVYPLTQTVTYPYTAEQYCTDDSAFLDCQIYRNEEAIENNTQYSPAAGTYVYKANISDAQNYTNFQDTQTLYVNKGIATINLYLNGTQNNMTYTFEDYANITSTLNVSGKVFYLYSNFSGSSELINQGTDVLSNVTNNFASGVYNITSFWPGDENYTSDSKTYFMTVNKKATILFLYLNGTRGNRNYVNGSAANFTVELLGLSKPVELWSNYSDGQWKRFDYGISPLQNITVLAYPGMFNFTGNFTGDQNYTASYESWIATVINFVSKLESLEPKEILQEQNSTVVGNCSCEGECSNVYIEVQANGQRLPTADLSINGTNPYYIGTLANSWKSVAWNITALEAGDYAIAIKCNSSETGDVFSTAQNLKVNDTQPPIWLNNISSPPSPAIYEKDKKYSFNITWLDNVGVDKVLMENNFTKTLANYTLNSYGNDYYFDVFDLSAGTYVYRFYANDTSGNMNYTDQWFYTVEKATTEIRLYLNGSESDKTYNLTQIANITAELNVSQKTIFLYSNMSGWVLQSSPTPLINYTTLKEKGTFNITAYFEGDENYTVSSKTRYLTVNDVKAPKYASTYQNASWVGVGHAIMLSANWTDDYDLDYAWLETNETGEWQKKQEVDINLTQGQTLANFSWSNSSIPAGRIIGWRIYANDTSGNTNTTEIMTFAVNASEVWRHATLGFIYSSPAVGDVNNDGNIDVVFASYDKNLYALTGYNGTRIFNFTTNGSIASSPSLSSISNSNYLYIFIASYDGNMYAVNGSDGKKIWNFSTQGLIYSSPALYDINSDGKLEIIFGSYDKNVYALDAETGVKIWNYSTGGKIASSPAVVNMNGDVLIVFGSYDNKLYALNSTGNLLWQFEAGDKIESSPAIDDVNSDGIYEIAFGSYDNKTYLLNASNGQLIWSYPTNNWITSSPVIANIGGSKKVIIASHDSNVYCFNANGSINWTFAIPTGGRIQSSPSIADVDLDGVNDVILGSSDSRLYALSGLTGKPIWHYKVNAYIFSSPTIADINGDGNLDFLFGSLDKNQYALDPPAWLLFGGNERRTRIFDATPPENVYFEINNETRQIASLWQEKFSNLAYAIITENSTGQVIQHAVRLKGMQDWVNLSFYTRGFYFNIQVFDEYNNSNIIEGFIEGERDTKPPVWLGNSSSTFVYQPNAVYEFLINWTDDSGVELSILEHNFTGTRMNESISSSYTIKDLPAGVYSWKSYARDYAGNWNETDEFYLIIEKSPGSVDLIANNSTYPNNVSVVCFGSMLFRNSSILSSLSDFSRLPSGAWNYTCFKDEEKNYTSAAKETIILVNKGLPMLNLSVSAGDKCPTVVNVKAFESNEGDSDIIYKLSNGTNEFYGSNISLTYRVLSGSYSFNYSSSLGMNWSSSFIARTIFVNDTTKPRNIYHKTLIQNNTVILSSTWEDKCSKISKGIITENSLGFYRNHTVSADKNQINYTFDVSDLRDRRGCRIFVGFICLKIVSYRITALDDFNNSNSVSGTFYYWFFLR